MFTAFKPLRFILGIASPTHSATSTITKKHMSESRQCECCRSLHRYLAHTTESWFLPSHSTYLFPLQCPPGSLGDKGHKRDPPVLAAAPCILVWHCGGASSSVPGQEDRSKVKVAIASARGAGTSLNLQGPIWGLGFQETQ